MTKKEKENVFDLTAALNNINPYLRHGFMEYIKGKSIKTQKQFDKYYKSYGALR